MSEHIDVVRVNATGALIRLHDGNQRLATRAGMTKTVARQTKAGGLEEVDGADTAVLLAASADLVRLGQGLLNNAEQKRMLLTSALKLPGAADYLNAMGIEGVDAQPQSVDQATLKSEAPTKPDESKPAPKKSSKKSSKKSEAKVSNQDMDAI